MIDNDDFFDPDLKDESGNETTKRVIDTFNKWQQLETAAAAAKLTLDTANADIAKIRTETMPALLAEMGTEIWRDPETGLTVELETAVNSALPKDQDKRNAIFKALRPIGIDEILAEEFNVSFAPNDKRAAAVREILGLSQPDEPDDLVESEDEGAEPAFKEPLFTNRQLALLADLKEELGLKDLPAEEKLGAHPSRLKSWLKKRIDAGKGPQIKEAGIWFGKHAKVDTKKAK